jgi:hypothetical protein
LAVFALSTFTPTQRFGTLMLALLLAALIGDLIFLPALLAGPLGAIFKAQKQDDDDTGPARLATEEGAVGGDESAKVVDSSAGEGKESAAARDRPIATPHSRSMRREGELKRVDDAHRE